MKNKKAPPVAAAMLAVLAATGCSVESGQTGLIDPAAGTMAEKPWEAEFDQGKEHLASGYFGLALQQFKAALGMNPQSVRVMNALAVTYDRLGRFDLADLYYERALAIEPGSAITLNNLGYSLLTRERYEQALIYFERAKPQEKGVARMIAANRQMAMDRLRIVRQRQEQRAFAKASLPSAPTAGVPEADCRSREALVIGRAGERVFSLVTSLADTISVPIYRGPGRSAGGDCERSGSPRVAFLHTGAPREAGQLASDRARGPAVATSAKPRPESGAKAVADAPKELKVEISNGAGRNKLAARMRSYYASKGLAVSYLTNAASFTNRTTTIFYKPGTRAAAERFAKQLPIAVEMVEAGDGFADIRIRLGADILEFDRETLYAAGHGGRNA